MSIFELQVEPIDQWPGPMTADRKPSRFRAGYGDTMRLIETELRHLWAKSPVLLMALSREDIRLDGRPRANAKPEHPGVILCAGTRYGPARWPCDRYTHWGDNLRAIGLSLAALRAVDRYGVTRHGEQYRGWTALPAPGDSGEFSTREAAMEFLRTIIGGRVDVLRIDDALREAEKLTHPDRGGSAEAFKRVQAARRRLLA